MGEYVSDALRRFHEWNDCNDAIFCSVGCIYFLLRNRRLFNRVSHAKVADDPL